MTSNYQDYIAYSIVALAVLFVVWRLVKTLKKKPNDGCNTGHHCDGCSESNCDLKDIATKIPKKNVPLNKKI